MTPTPLDLVVLTGIAAVLAFPVLKKASLKVYAKAFSKDNLGNPDAVEAWRQKWTGLLITLGREIEGGEGGLADSSDALRLNRELMWEIIGGEPEKQASKK